MKKILFIIISFSLFISFSYAQLGKTIFKANIRSLPNIKTSKILFVSEKGQNFEIIEKINNSWYKIRLSNGKNVYIRDKAIILENEYILNNFDKKIVKKFVSILKKKSLKKRKIFLEKLKNLKLHKKNNIRIYTILDEILKNFIVKKIEEIQKNDNKKIEQKKINQPKKNLDEPIKYDIKKIRKTWINWHNEVRKKMGLVPYIENEKLNISAKNWSITNKDAKKIDHRRHIGDPYYDYKKITKWMKDNGVVCKNIHRVTYSESIARDWMTCNKSDCTNEIIKAIREAFDYFMREKGISGIAGAHYRAIVHSTFRQIGFDISIEKTGKNSYRVYSTTHYCTQVR